MTLSALNYHKDFKNQTNNYGVQETPKKYIFSEKKPGKFSKTNYNLLERHPLAKSILNFVLAMGFKEGDDFLFVVASYASRCGKSAPTVRNAIKYLVSLGHCIMIRHVGRPTEFFFSRYPFTQEEKDFLRDGCSDGVDSEEENIDISETAPCAKNFSTATYLVNLLLYINNKHNNNLVSPKPVPNVVVEPQNNFENKKTHDTDTCKPENCRAKNETVDTSPTNRIDSNHSFPVDTNSKPRNTKPGNVDPLKYPAPSSKTRPHLRDDKRIKVERDHSGAGTAPETHLDFSLGHNTAIDAILENVKPEHRDKIPIPLLDKHIDDYSIKQLADICIYAIDKTSSGNRNPEHHRRRIEGYCRVLFNEHVTVPAQKYYTTFENRGTIPLPVPVQTDYDYKKKWDEHHTRVKKVTEACVKEKPKIENIKEKTDTYENVFDTVDMGSLIDRLKGKKPVIDPKYKSRRKYLDRIGRPDLRSI